MSKLPSLSKQLNMATRCVNDDQFNNLSSKVAQLQYGRSKNNRTFIWQTLSDLNSINYKYPVVTIPTKAVLLINQCCTLINTEDTELVTKCCHLIVSLITQQGVVVEGRTLTATVTWCLKALKQQNSDVDVLLALDSLLRTSTKCELIADVVKNAAVIHDAKNNENPEIALSALQCLEACTFATQTQKTNDPGDHATHLNVCFDIFVNYLLRNNGHMDKLSDIKMIAVCLRGIQHFVTLNPDLVDANLGVILGIIKTYMLYGVRGIEFIAPQKLMPSTHSIAEPSTFDHKRGAKVPKHRKPANLKKSATKSPKQEEWGNSDSLAGYTPVNPLDCLTEDTLPGNHLRTSDSDFSDTERGKAAAIFTHAGRVRQTSLALFVRIAQLVEKKVMFSYWSSFIPENSLSGKHYLTACILKDTSAKGRIAALNVLLVLLTSSKGYLAQAEKGANLAFTPFSFIVALMITELHKCLTLALNDRSVFVLIQVLRCLAALVQATPYHKLAPGLLKKVIRNVKLYIKHKDPAVQVAVIILLGCILASDPTVPETKEAFTKNVVASQPKTVPQPTSTDQDEDDCFHYADTSSSDEEISDNLPSQMPWVLEYCASNLGIRNDGTKNLENTASFSIKLESLQVLSAMSCNYFESFMAPHLSIITLALDAALTDKFSDVRLYAGKAVDFIGQAINLYFKAESDQKTVPISMAISFWNTLLNGGLTALLQDEEHANLRAVGCDCIASIGAYIFEHLPRKQQILYVSILFGLSRDEENSVKGAAIRAIAIFINYSCLMEDPGFVVDTIQATQGVLKDSHTMVRVKASWALGNLSDSLILIKSKPDFFDDIRPNLLLGLLKTANGANADVDKVKMNIVRAIGNILQLITADLIYDPRFKDAVQEGINVLVKLSTTASNMKVRWNACHALSNMMKNEVLFTSDLNWQPPVFASLADLVTNFRNFKVRTNAAEALATPSRRHFYEHWYQSTWDALLKSLETSRNMEDCTEYQRRDSFVEQICLSLGHLVVLMEKNDLCLLDSCITEHLDSLKMEMKRVWDRLLPEKSTILFEAKSHVDALNADGMLSNEQRRILGMLVVVLDQQY